MRVTTGTGPFARQPGEETGMRRIIVATLGIRQGLLRLSVGLEHADDLVADLARALGD